tara:strand:- start:746 stop:1348 length:603 start_codon:yes stop_codon:yes gene_type:complete
MTEPNNAPPRAPTPKKAPPARRRFLFILVPTAFAILASILAWELVTGSANKNKLPSALIDKAIPQFELDPLPGNEVGLSSLDIEQGGVSLVNVFASWCGPCRIEHPLLMEIAKLNLVPIWGLNYKDQPADAVRWLQELDNPYSQIGSDLSGRVGIDWGVYGVPETFVIDSEKRIVYKHIGVLTRIDWEEKIRPLIESLKE